MRKNNKIYFVLENLKPLGEFLFFSYGMSSSNVGGDVIQPASTFVIQNQPFIISSVGTM